MRWFTREAIDGDDSVNWSKLVASYWQHLEQLHPRLPGGLLPLASPDAALDLHDGLIDRLEERGDASIVLGVLRGNVQAGYSLVELTYFGAEVYTESFPALRLALNAVIPLERGDVVSYVPMTEILYDEIDEAEDGHFVHRFLLFPFGEFAVRFRDFSFQVEPVSERRLPPRVDRVSDPRDADDD
jgi:hypothetical protein